MDENKEMIAEFLVAAGELQQAVVNYQTKAAALQDFGVRVRGMTEHLQTSGGNLDDPHVIRLPRAIMPKMLKTGESGAEEQENRSSKKEKSS